MDMSRTNQSNLVGGLAKFAAIVLSVVAVLTLEPITACLCIFGLGAAININQDNVLLRTIHLTAVPIGLVMGFAVLAKTAEEYRLLTGFAFLVASVAISMWADRTM